MRPRPSPGALLRLAFTFAVPLAVLLALWVGRPVGGGLSSLREVFVMSTSPKPAAAPKLRVALDAGHGFENRGAGRGYDPGACAHGVTEAALALEWAASLKAYFVAQGAEVFMVRTSATDSNPVGGRDEQAEAAKANLYISVHFNAGPPAARGTETLYRSAADKDLASIVQAAAVKALGTKDRGVKSETASQHGRLAVFDFDSGPACLLEVGFISNDGDRAIGQNDEKRRAACEAIVTAVAARYGRAGAAKG